MRNNAMQIVIFTNDTLVGLKLKNAFTTNYSINSLFGLYVKSQGSNDETNKNDHGCPKQQEQSK